MMLGLKISVTLLLWLNLAAGGLEIEVPVIEEDKLIFTHIVRMIGFCFYNEINFIFIDDDILDLPSRRSQSFGLLSKRPLEG